MNERFLVPLDGSPLAKAVLLHAQTPAQSLGVELVLLRVMESLVVKFSSTSLCIAPKAIRIFENKIKNYLYKIIHNWRPQECASPF